MQTISTVPAGYTGDGSTADLHLTPDGRFLYGSNRGNNTLAAFSVDPGTGTLVLIDFFATEATPRSFAIDPTGNFLYAAGQASGRVAAHRIDRASGRLTRIATYSVGPAPAWVEVIAVD
jgi:6-phosphogluconolactonase